MTNRFRSDKSNALETESVLKYQMVRGKNDNLEDKFCCFRSFNVSLLCVFCSITQKRFFLVGVNHWEEMN